MSPPFCRRQPVLVPLLVGWCLLTAPPARAQPDPAPRLVGLTPAGPRASVTEAWGALRFEVTNFAPADRDLRVLVFYPEQPGVQYGRDLWVPGQATASAWLPVGPAADQRPANSREIKFLLYEKADGQYRQVSPDQPERLRNRVVLYKKREPTTSILLDGVADDLGETSALDRATTPDAQAVQFARVFRQARGLSEHVSVVGDRFLPPTAEAFHGVDQFVLAGNRLAADPAGAATLRHWVQQGGTLWVMLDRVRADTLAPVLGADLGFAEVDRTSLTSVRLTAVDDTAPAPPREFDEPVDLVRVVVGDADTVLTRVNGWPAAFSRPLGRGKVVVTTLGGRAWHRPRAARERRSAFQDYPNLPVELLPLERLAVDLAAEPEKGGFRAADFAPMLSTEIGYRVVAWRTAAGILGGFVVALVGLGVLLRRSRRPELLGWLGPAAAVAAAAAFVTVGLASRQAVPPTEGMAAVLVVDPGSEEAAADGLFAVYRPTSGDTRVTAAADGVVDLDAVALEGQSRRRVQTDLDRWHWENMTLPAGVRTGPARAAVSTGPVRAVARFGPNGVEGRLTAGVFRDLSDAVVVTPARDPAAVRFGADGTFAVGPADSLPAGQFLAGTVLSDRQQRRQEVYRRLLARPLPRAFDGRDLLFAWADADALPFGLAGAERSLGAALLAVPVEFDRSPAGTAVTIPRGFVGVSAAGKGRRGKITLTSANEAEVPVRFQLPASVLPLAVDRATLHLKIRAAGRKVTVTTGAVGGKTMLFEAVSPVDPIRVEITDPPLLALDADGGLTVAVSVGKVDARPGDRRPAGSDAGWEIESLALEAAGRVEAVK